MVQQYLILIFVCLVLTGKLQAQQSFGDSSLLLQTIKDAWYRYDSLRGAESAIYNGIRLYPYPSDIEGTAFFQSPDFQKGTIVYEDRVYNNISMNYDLFKDQVIVSPEDKAWLTISIFSPRISEFSLGPCKFIYLRQPGNLSSLSDGFYKVMTEGKITAFARHKKTIFKTILNDLIYRRFDEITTFYLLEDGIYYPVGNIRDLLRVVKKHKKEVQQFLSQAKLKFRKNPEKTIHAAVELYNKLEN